MTFDSTSGGDDPELARRLEELAAGAWPASSQEPLDGWRLRYHYGVSRRANSVLPNSAGGALSLEEKLARVEAFYTARGAPARYQISPAAAPSDLDSILDARGYRVDALTQVQTADLDAVVAAMGALPEGEITLWDGLVEEWFSVYRQAEGVGPTADARRETLRAIRPPTGYALLRLGGKPAALGLGVAQEGWLGLFCMATLPALRRRGAATAVLRRLAEWGKTQGALQAYLQVMEENVAARALYARAGFALRYRYHYREAQERQGSQEKEKNPRFAGSSAST